MAHHVVRVVGVAHAVGAAQQHLGEHVGGLGADQRQALPRVFVEEAHRHVEGGAAPALQRQQLGQAAGVGLGDADDVAGAHAGGQQRLVGVAHGGVGDEHALLVAHPLGELGGAEFLEALAGAGLGVGGEARRLGLAGVGRRQRAVAGLRVAVDGDVGDPAEQLGGAVLALAEVEQRRRFVDEAGGVVVGDEARVAHQVVQEGQVGGHAADAELHQRAVHAADRLPGGRRPGGDLLEQRVVEARDHRAGVGRAAIDADAEAHRAAVGADAAVVGDEVVLGVLGGDAALQRVAGQADLRLGRDAGLAGVADVATLGDADLGLHDVEAGDHLGDGVLHLDARVHLDEVELAGVGVHQELDGAGAHVVRRAADGQRRLAQALAGGVVEVGRRGALDHLLVAALDRAVALEQVHQVAVAVAEDLHLHVAGAAHQLLEVHLVLAEGALGLAAGRGDGVEQGLLALDRAHAAAAAAPRGLQHHRVADLAGEALDLLRVVRQRRGGRHHRRAAGDGQVARRDLVAQGAHGVGARADEDDAGGGAGLGELGALGEQAVARVDRVGARLLGDADHLVDGQVALQRAELAAFAAADLVGLVGLEAVQGELVFLGVDGDRVDAEFGCGPEYADGDFGAVGNKEATDHAGYSEGGGEGGPPAGGPSAAQ